MFSSYLARMYIIHNEHKTCCPCVVMNCYTMLSNGKYFIYPAKPKYHVFLISWWLTDQINQSEIGWGETCFYLFYVIVQWYCVTILWYLIWFMAPVSLYQVNPNAKRLLDTWLGFRCKLIPQICVVHPNEQYSHGCDSLIGVSYLFWCISHFVLYCTTGLSRISNGLKMYLGISRGIK